MNTPRLTVSLRISGDSLDPDFLTQQLGVAPRSSADDDMEPDERAATGVWSYGLTVPGVELGEVVGMLLAVFPEDSTLWEEITSSYDAVVRCDVFLRDGDQRTGIDPDVLAGLARRGLPLYLALHAPSHDDDYDDDIDD